MERLDHTRTVAAALVHLGEAGSGDAGLSHKVDALVDAYLVTFSASARQTAAMRKILADEFLGREDADLPEPLRVASDLLLPELEFPPPAPFILQRSVAPPSRAAAKARRSFFGWR
jgi:hypothetical protein